MLRPVGRHRTWRRCHRDGKLTATIGAWQPLEPDVSFCAEPIFATSLTVLARQLAPIRCYIGINTLRLLFSEFRNVIPILLQTICDLVCSLGITQLEDRVVVHGPILSLLVLSPYLLAFDAEYLDTNAAWRGNVVRHDLWGERGVAHDAIVAAGLREHSLSEMRREVVVDDEFANDALPIWSVML